MREKRDSKNKAGTGGARSKRVRNTKDSYEWPRYYLKRNKGSFWGGASSGGRGRGSRFWTHLLVYIYERRLLLEEFYIPFFFYYYRPRNLFSMQRTRAQEEEFRGEAERKVKYRGTARIRLEWLHLRGNEPRELDRKNVKR